MQADVKFKMPFNFVQVLIAAFGAMALSALTFFIAEAAGASMKFSDGMFQNFDFIHIIRFTVPPIVVLGFLTFLIARGRPGFCRIAQVIGLALLLLSAVTQLFFAEDAGSAIAVAIMHVIVGASWYIAVNNSNKKANERAMAG
ncbi:DUF6069 family protein [Glutamicibacter protophormiae]|uniref:ABC-type multidrug transport system permease subunit n=1 Tax=Glutamicibacter protophormiae TaxID=37930 RepID=A0ABS4XN84_GLUPR|nr:DUF6069 family protein [Glutamicibacter protophormiae]MBP2397722.1 ABC-type multidrug transport system permease subunit [Glutamicibacter protophormiae]QRQ78411.1 hypothetical protein JQN66_16160 [Glutamicibacter protophormiae]GGL87051.1 hypothetical protein GCM10010038_16380 [Glutamicibacter protophormiae]